MQFRHWLASGVSLGLFVSASGLALAQPAPPNKAEPGKLPPACVAAGATTPAACAAYLKKSGPPKGEPAAKPEHPAAPTAKPVEPPAKPVEPAKPAEPPVKVAPKVPPVVEKPAAKPELPPVKPETPAAKPEAPATVNKLPPKTEAPAATPRHPGAGKDCAVDPAHPNLPCVKHPGRPGAAATPPAAKPAVPAEPAGKAPPKAPPAVTPPATEKPAAPAATAPESTPPAKPEPAQPAPAAQQPPAAPPPAKPATPPQGKPVTPPNTTTPAATGTQTPPPGTPSPVKPTAAGEAAVAGQPKEPVRNLPKGVTQQEVAPLLDSAKQVETGTTPPGVRPPQAGATRPRPPGPPPKTDEAAQTGLKHGPVKPIDTSKGQQIPQNGNKPLITLPTDVTVVAPPSGARPDFYSRFGRDRNNGGAGFGNGSGNGPGNGPGSHRGPGGQPPPDRQGGPSAANPLGLGLGIILQLGNEMIVNSPGLDQRRIADDQRDHTIYEQLPGERYRETITRPNGVRIVTVYDRDGDVLRRSRIDADGHETILAYFDASQDRDLSDWHDPGADLPPLQLDIPPQDYVLDADNADEQRVQDFFEQPPVEHVQRLYSLDEVKRSARIRDMMPRLELGDLTFDTGAATISEDQIGRLDTVARAMLALLQRNPAETFLIEGHTDAVGSEISNLQLSDARAATVAQVLTDFYHIPPENLATQGYGERFLKVQTDGPERLNRRVAIRRITPLVTVANQNY